MVGLDGGSDPAARHRRRGGVAELAARNSMGSQLHPGKLVPNLSRRSPLSRFSFSICPTDLSDAGGSYQADRARVLAPCRLLRGGGRSGHGADLADFGKLPVRGIGWWRSC